MFTDRTVASLPEYISEVLSYRSRWMPTDSYPELWYRGCKSHKFELKPGAYRASNCDENSLALSFRSLVPSLLPFQPADDWDWYYLMQHYGLPTRLLDWTESPLHALYFAVEQFEPGACPCVWVLDPTALNETAHGSSNCVILTPVGTDVSSVLRAWLPGQCGRGIDTIELSDESEFSSNEYPIAIYPKRHNARITAQRGTFTVHGTDERGLEDLPITNGASEPRLDRILIDPSKRLDMLDELWMLGFNRAAAYPEPQSVSEDLKRMYMVG